MLIAQLEFALDDAILTQRTLHLRIGKEDVSIFCDQAAARLNPQPPSPASVKDMPRSNASWFICGKQ